MPSLRSNTYSEAVGNLTKQGLIGCDRLTSEVAYPWDISCRQSETYELRAMSIESNSFFGIILSTYREKDLSSTNTAFFQYESVIAAFSVLFCRMTISSHEKEPFLLRLFFALCLAFLAYWRKPYEILCALHVFSYMVPWSMTLTFTKLRLGTGMPDKLTRFVFIAVSAAFSLALSHLFLSDHFVSVLVNITPHAVKETVLYLIPIEEVMMAYNVIVNFVDPTILNKQLAHLLFVTFNLQVGIGYIGIDFLKKEQLRRNQLVRMDIELSNEEVMTTSGKVLDEVQTRKAEASRRFQRGAAPFILATATPYMLQIIFYGNMNFFAFTCVKHDLHRAVRLNELFDHDSHLVAMSNKSATSPDGKWTITNTVTP